jgi:hypothetical protein
MKTQNRNTTRFYIFEFENGMTINEKCRNSFGGFNNCIQRIGKMFNSTCGPLDSNGDKWQVRGEVFTITETTKDGMIID